MLWSKIVIWVDMGITNDKYETDTVVKMYETI